MELKHGMQTTTQKILRIIARLVTTAAAIAVITLVGIFLFNNPYASGGMNRGTQWTMTALVVLSIFAVGAAWKTRPRSLLIYFLISFIPVGFYLLLTPGIFALIGAAQLGFLLSAALLAKSRPL